MSQQSPMHRHQQPHEQQIQGPLPPNPPTNTTPAPHDAHRGLWHWYTGQKRSVQRGCGYGTLIGILFLCMGSFFTYRSMTYTTHIPPSGSHVLTTTATATTGTTAAKATTARRSQPTPVPTTGIWKPPLNTSWQWQLTTPVDQSINVTLYDIDGFDNAASVVAALHAQGRKVFCYIDAGMYENWRSDANRFSSFVKGNAVQGWAGEQWLDIRQLQVLAPIMQARLDMCQTKGFDGVEFDNVDGYTNDTGFPLTANDQLAYNTWFAHEAHLRGMSAGLKNDLDQVQQLLPSFDWALDEQCFRYQECDLLTPFIRAGKAVFEVEYAQDPSQFCPQANALDFNSLRKNLALDAPMTACR
jgi:hypothetical protein